MSGEWVSMLVDSCDDASLARARDTSERLALLDLDEDSVRAGFLAGLGDQDADVLDAVLEKVGGQTRELFDSASQLNGLSGLANPQESQSKAREENLRRMLIAMVDDVRVVLIALAAQLSRLNAAKSEPEDVRRALGRLTHDVYAPLASRLGVWQFKWEMEDLAFRFLQPRTYSTLAAALEDKRRDREAYSDEMAAKVMNLLGSRRINAEVSSRPKHIYSIWNKMNKKGLELAQLWDLQAARILVETVDDCYAALSAVHETWDHYASEFVDYIATPKANGYRSIHTVIIGPANKPVEIQIRTQEMHSESELGMAAHWRYKESIGQDQGLDRKIVWLRQLLEWKEGLGSRNPDEAVAPGQDRIYVFTPRGSIIDLPGGATPIDFAYAIHSEVGHRTRGALVNNKMVALNTELATGDQVAIQTVKQGGPSLDWLRGDQGYVRTSRARSRILQWFKQHDYEDHVAEGRTMLDKELGKSGLSDLAYEKVLQHTHFEKVNDMLAAIGSRDYKLSRALAPFKSVPETGSVPIRKSASHTQESRGPADFKVQGVGNLLTQLAQCCSPVPGEPIVGYITAGKGVSIHRQDCVNVQDLNPDRELRLVEVEWGSDQGSHYTLSVTVIAYHRNGLLSDITDVVKGRRGDILKANMETDDEHITELVLRLDVHGETRPENLIAALKSVRNVMQVRRIS